MVNKQPSAAMAFIVAQLERDPTIEYGTIKQRAAEQGLTIFPVVYGKARASLGLVPKRPRKEKEKAEPRDLRNSNRAAVAPRTHSATEDFEGRLVRAMTDLQGRATADSQRLREAMRKAIEVLREALGS